MSARIPRARRSRRSCCISVLAAASAAVSLLPSASATVRSWVGPSGSAWSLAANWSPSGAPVAGDTAYITLSPASPFSLTFDANYSGGALATFTVNSSTVSPLTVNQFSSSTDLFTGIEFLATTGRAAFVQSAGTNSASSLFLAENTGSSASYSLSATALVNASSCSIGETGAASFSQSGGSASISNSLYLADLPGSSASYSLSAGSLTLPSGAYEEYLGNSGVATFSQSGGTHTINSSYFTVGWGSSGTGTYNLSAGTLAVSSAEFLGWEGHGTFLQSGGSHVLGSSLAATSLAIGDAFGAVGLYSLSSTGSLSVFGTENIGGPDFSPGGTGSFLQSGGSHAVSASLVLGSSTGATGSYSLSAGSLSVAQDEFLGNASSSLASFSQSGGTHTISSIFGIGYAAGSTASYSLSAGSLLLSPSALYEAVGFFGAATFSQSGGTHTVNAGNLTLGEFASSTGTYQLSGGSLSTSCDEFVGWHGQATFIQTAGSHTIGSPASPHLLVIGDAPDSSALYSLSGTGSLSVANEYIAGHNFGSAGSATFLQSGGSHSVTTELDLANAPSANASYSLSAGSLSVGNAEVLGNAASSIASFTQSGGTHTVSYILNLAAVAGSSASYSLSAGSLVLPSGAYEEYVGGSGAATFSQSGGTHSINSTYFNVGLAASATGTYLLSAGTLSSVANEFVGWQGSGTFFQSGGSHLCGNAASFHSLAIGDLPGAFGLYSLSATGYLYVGVEYLGGPDATTGGTGSFVQSGGTHVISDVLVLGSSASATGSYSLSAGSLSVGADELLGNAAGSLASFSQSGGSHSVAGTLNLAPSAGASASFSLSGGSLTVGSINTNGEPSRISFTGGTLTFTNPYSLGPALFPSLTLSPAMTLVSSANGANYGSITLAGGTLAGSASLTNSSLLLQSSGNASTVAGPLYNSPAGDIELAPAAILTLNSPLSNDGLLSLNGVSIQGTGSLLNNPAGTISGRGALYVVFTNNGTLVLPGGALFTPGFTNTGLVQLNSPTAVLSGAATVTNAGTVQGFGKIASPLLNNSTLEPLGGTLILAGALTNSPSATLRVSTGNKLLVSSGLASNAGLISLTGGTFDNNNLPLTNNGSIAGFGTLATGGAGLLNNGAITLAGGTSTLNGPVTNSVGHTLEIRFAPAVFTALVTNNGTLKLTGASANATFAGGYSGNPTSEPLGLVGAGFTSIDPAASFTSIPLLQQSSLTNSGLLSLLPSSQGGQPSQVDSLTLLPGSSFDLADNPLTTSTSPDTLRSYLAAALLTSSTAAADPQHLHALGYLTTGPSTLVKLALLGDANLDGKVNADDYALIDRSFARHTSDAHWQDGDFNYDGQITSADYLLLDTTFGKLTGQLPESLLAERLSQFGPAYVSALTAAVPEPSTLAFLLSLSTLLLPRRTPLHPRLARR